MHRSREPFWRLLQGWYPKAPASVLRPSLRLRVPSGGRQLVAGRVPA
jgi:hypothetical protein